MRIKNILMAGIIAVTSISLPTLANAETSYATPQELLIEALEVAVSGVESTTYDEALDYVESLITVNGAEVSYDGDVIGYWDSTNSDTLFSDSAFTDEVLSNGGTNIWEFEPDILSPMLTTFNNKLVETIVSTTEDWSKIIGKYDVSLGDMTIDAEHWLPLTPSENPLADHTTVNPAAKWGWGTSGNLTQGENPVMIGYAIDADGKLYLQSTALLVEVWSGLYNSGLATTSSNSVQLSMTGESGDIKDRQWSLTTYPYVRVGMEKDTLHPVMYFTNADNSRYYHSMCSDSCIADHSFKLLGDPSIIYDGDVEDLKQVGVLVTKTGSFCTRSSTLAATDFLSIFTRQPTSSKEQIGNTTLKQRLNKFSSLVDGDTIEVTPTSWTIIGLGGEESDFDTYLGSQDIMAPGEETSIPATADIEALAFKVVLPTSLPIYVNELNQVSVATNATIKNESGAAVVVNSVNIEAKQDSGWTLLTSGTPSKARDAKEFTFTTDLAADTVLAVAEERPFRYNAELSPSTEGVEQLDLAEVLVTIDWAEVT